MFKKGKVKAASKQGSQRRVLGIGIGLTLLVALLALNDTFKTTELKTIDWRFETRGPRPVTAPVVIVAMDDESINGWQDENGGYRVMPERWQWPRDFYAKAIDNLHAAGAKLIVFDLVYSESTKSCGRDQDAIFGQSTGKAGNVIFSERHVVKPQGGIKTETLIPALEKARRDKGHSLPEIAADNFIRAYRPLFFSSRAFEDGHTEDEILDANKPALELAVLRQFLWGKRTVPSYDPARNVVSIGDREIPLNAELSLGINFNGPAGTVPTYPFHNVYYKDMDMSVFKDKVVYIGATSEALHDNHRTPFAASGDRMPGVETHAQFFDTLYTQRYLRHFSVRFELALIIGLGLLASAFSFRVKPWQGLTIALLITGIYAVVSVLLFIERDMVLPLFSPMVSVLLSFTGITVYRAVVEEKAARTTRQMFSRYVSKNIVDEILKNPGAVALGGQMKETTILFSDVRGFTAMSEKLDAPQVVEVLNEYLTAMVDIVIANGGTLDKYVGDAIMAVWGSPLPDPKHRENGVKAAVQMMEVLRELRAKWKLEGKPDIDIGIGLNTGRVVAGNMGHPDFKMDYTVIGDDVNLAARMESANKEMKSHVLITGITYEGCKDLVDVIEHPPIHVKGKEKSIDVYEVIGWKGQGRAPWAVPLP